MLFSKKIQKKSYDKEHLKPVIQASICTGAQVAGFQDIHTGKFTEVMLIRESKDMDVFLETYDISIAQIEKKW